MPDIFNERPRPGDLITADFANELITAIEALTQRVSTLEQAQGTVTITGISGSLRIGGQIRVMGSNFEVPARFNTVTLDNLQIVSFSPGTDDSNLIFNIPQISGVPREVTLTISNRNGTASWRFTVLPAQQTVTGELIITELDDDHGLIEVGQTYTFRFRLTSQTNVAEDYLVAARYSAAVGAPATAWQEATVIVNPDQQPIESIRIAPRSPVVVGVQVTILPTAESVNLALQVNSVSSPSDPLLNRTSNPISIEVGEEVETSHPFISFDALQVAGQGRLVLGDPVLGEVIEVDSGREAFVRVTAEFELGGVYTYSTSILPETPDIWQAAVAFPSPPTSNEEPGGEQDIVVSLNHSGSSSPGPSCMLEIRATRVSADPTGQFASWRRVPIRRS
jgi:hypothetical protein